MFKALTGIQEGTSQRGLIRTWAKGIVVFIAIALGCIILISAFSYYIFDKNIDRNNRLMLNHVSDYIDANLSEATRQLNKTLWDGDTMQIARAQDVSSLQYSGTKKSLSEKLRSFCVVNSFVSDILLYFPQQDYFITSQTVASAEVEHYATFASYVLDYAAWRKVFLDQPSGSLITLKTTNAGDMSGNKNMLFYTYTASTVGGKEYARAYFQLDGAELLRQLITYVDHDSMSMAVLLNDGTIFVADTSELIQNVLHSPALKEFPDGENGDIVLLNIDGNRCYLRSSKCMGLIYVFCSVGRLGTQAKVVLMAITVLSSILLIGVAIVIAYRYTGSTFVPLMEIREMLTIGELKKEESELEQIRDAIFRGREQAEAVSLKLDLNEERLQSSYLKSLLLGSGSESDRDALLTETGMNEDSFAVLMFSPDDDGTSLSSETEQAVFLILEYDSIRRTLAGAGISVRCTLFSDAFVLTANLPESAQEDWDQLASSIAHTVTARWENKYDVPLLYSYSGVNRGKSEMVVRSYTAALLAMRFKLSNSFGYSKNSEPTEDRMLYNYHSFDREKFINIVKNGTADEIAHYIRDAWEMNNSHKLGDILIECLSSDVTRTILELLSTCPVDAEKEKQLVMRVAYIQKIKPADRREELIKLASDISLLLSNVKDTKQEEFYQDIAQYIEENYADPELSVDSICTAFGKSHNTVYQAVKAATGNGILNLINGVRVTHAKELLEKPGITVENAAIGVGLSSALALFRIFKRHEGMTPGKYIELYQRTK